MIMNRPPKMSAAAQDSEMPKKVASAMYSSDGWFANSRKRFFHQIA
jgi:hypothetical protein